MSHTLGAQYWKKLSLFGAIPAVILLSIKTFYEHHEEEKHHVRPEFIPYDHLRIRNKRFPWGDGQRSLFHNPKTNPLPTGYEE